MITVSDVSVRVDKDASGNSLGTAPYTFVFSTDNTCATISTPTGTCALVDGYYTAITNVVYNTEACIGTTLVSCVITDKNGCSSTMAPVIIDNPCNLTNTITNSGEYVFVSATTGGSGSYTYQWLFNPNIFETYNDVNPTDNYLSLKIKQGANIQGTTTSIRAIVTDANGCTLNSQYTYTFCQPMATNVNNIPLHCDTTPVKGLTTTFSQYQNYDLREFVTPCANQVLAWLTLEFATPAGLAIINNGDGTITVGSSESSPSTKVASFRVRTTTGIPSNWANITITVPDCVEVPAFRGVPNTTQLTASNTVGEVITIPVEKRVSAGANWSSFAFTNTPSFGTVTFNADREIEYTIVDNTTTTNIPDIIKWSLPDVSGNQINITDTILRDAIAAPVAVGNVLCLPCGTASAPTDVLANDTGDIDRSTLTLVSTDVDVTITKDTSNNLTFTVIPGVTGFNNTSQYKVANTQGVFSNNANIIVVTTCAGIPQDTVLTCTASKTFDLIDKFTNPLSLVSTFTETTTDSPTYTAQGGLITGPNGTVDLSAIATDRYYTFQLQTENTAGCSGVYSYGEVSIYHGTTPHITFGTAVDNGNGTSTYPFTYSGLASTIFVQLNSVPASFQLTPSLSNGTGTFTIYNVSGVNSVSITASSVCGTTIVTTDATLTIP